MKTENETEKKLKDPSTLPYYSDISDIEDKHFIYPSRATEGLSIPTLSEWVIAQMGCLPTKYLVISGDVLKRNRAKHRELVFNRRKLSPNRAKNVLEQALYQADRVVQGTNPTYKVLKSFAVKGKVYNAVATINPISPTYADCMEVVDWFIE